MPALADKLAPLIPLRVERWLGEAVDMQARQMLDKGDASRPFECGERTRAAQRLANLMAKLEVAAALPIPLEIKVVRRSEANAIALPGGHIYVFEGLVEKSETPTSWRASSPTRSAMWRIATARARSCSPPVCRSCSACCSATSSAAARS